MNGGRANEHGFTLVELTIVAVLTVLLVGVIGSSAGIASRTMAVAERRADATERLLQFFARITEHTRSGVLSTFRVESTAADVGAGRAAGTGEWIAPVDGEARPAIQFRAADGNLAINAASLTSPVVIRFQRDPGEDATVGDDDGDGLVDEGSVTFGYDGEISATVLTGVGNCEFVLDGSLLTVRVRTARRADSDRVFQLEQVFSLRNN